jgi:ketosteroid isomerase-like protein
MSHLEEMREGYAAYSRRDYSFADTLFAEDIDWSVPDSPESSGKLHGREAVKGFFETLGEQFTAHTIALDDAVESGDRLVCFVRHTFTRPDGVSTDVEAVHDWTWRSGQAVKMREIADTMGFAVAAGMMPAPAGA